MDRDLQGRIAALGGGAVLCQVALTREQVDAHDLAPPAHQADGLPGAGVLPSRVMAVFLAVAGPRPFQRLRRGWLEPRYSG